MEWEAREGEMEVRESASSKEVVVDAGEKEEKLDSSDSAVDAGDFSEFEGGVAEELRPMSVSLPLSLPLPLPRPPTPSDPLLPLLRERIDVGVVLCVLLMCECECGEAVLAREGVVEGLRFSPFSESEAELWRSKQSAKSVRERSIEAKSLSAD